MAKNTTSQRLPNQTSKTPRWSGMCHEVRINGWVTQFSVTQWLQPFRRFSLGEKTLSTNCDWVNTRISLLIQVDQVWTQKIRSRRTPLRRSVSHPSSIRKSEGGLRHPEKAMSRIAGAAFFGLICFPTGVRHHKPYGIHGTKEGIFTYMNGWFFMVFM